MQCAEEAAATGTISHTHHFGAGRFKQAERLIGFCPFPPITDVLSHWNFPHGKFGLLSPRKANCDGVVLPNLQCVLGVLMFP